MSNFDHLVDFPAVRDAARSAEGLARSEPDASAVLAGKALELALGWAFGHDAGLRPPGREGASAMIHDPDMGALMGTAVKAKARFINSVRNRAAHETGRLRPQGAEQVVEELHHVLHWFGRMWGTAKPPEPNPFDPAPLSARTDLIRSARARIEEADAALKARDAELDEMRARILTLDEQLAVRREAVAEARREDALRSDPHDYREDETRARLVDLQLREAGWSDLVEGRDLEVRVEPMPNEEGHGFADYVLWDDDGRPLAVVEAKRARRDPEDGRQQAVLYADALEAMHGQRPVIFTTNGYTHWIWDDARGLPPRVLGGFKTRQELREAIARRAGAEPLAAQRPDPAIAGRPYQARALTRIAESFDGGRRKALLVMATGTGKTRTVIALVDMMIRAGLVKRALFLADRISLVKQATGAFKAHLASAGAVNLVANPAETGRVYVSTYPTMMNLIDRAGADGARRFGPGHFDLVIVDEAHRSIYKRYAAIFDYFDAHLVGLTATPRDEVDRDTYRMFNLEVGHPTDHYGLEEAVEQGFLVPAEPVSVPTRIVDQGLRYDQLSEEEKEAWDEIDWGEDGPPEAVEAAAINKTLFNEDTVDKVLAHVMAHGVRVAGGDRIGKTIVFAVSKAHASFIEERFDAGWPELGGQFARRVVHGESYAHDLIDKFSDPAQPPHVAISVDMLDTGIDVPEVVNLVFFKAVRSKTKFWQMVGRGTRLRPGLFGPGQDKTAFRIFDVCRNLEFFGQDQKLTDPPVPQSLTERVIGKRVEVVRAIEDRTGDRRDADPDTSEVRAGLVDELRGFVAGLDLSSFVVRPKAEVVVALQADDADWSRIDDARADAIHEVADLPSAETLGEEEAKRFDLMMFELQLSLLGHSTKWKPARSKVTKMVGALSAIVHIPAVARHGELIEEMLTEAWWEGLTVPIVESARRRLRGVIHLIDRDGRRIVYTDFEDELGTVAAAALGHSGDFSAFRAAARAFVEERADHVTIAKLRSGKPLTGTDIDELERMFLDAGIGSAADIEKARDTQAAQVGGFGVFLRQLAGLDRAAIQTHFAALIADGATADQIEFVDMIIDHLTASGVMDPGLLYESPFTDRTPDGPDGVFGEGQVVWLSERVRAVNEAAEGKVAS